MKILFIINSYGSRSETFITDQISFYRDRMHTEVWSKSGDTIIDGQTSFKFPSLVKRWAFVLSNLKLIKLSDIFKILNRIQNLKYYFNAELLYYLIFIRKFKIDNKFDIVYAHFGMNGKLSEELIFFKELDVKRMFVNFHGLDLLSSSYSKKHYRHLFEKASGIICGSQYAYNQLAHLGNINKNTRVIPCGVNDSLFKSNFLLPKRHSEKIGIISVGRFVEFKGMKNFITLAMELLKMQFKDFHIQLIGTGPEFENIKATIQNQGLNNYIQLTGSLPHKDVSKKIYDSDVFVYLGIVDVNGRAETQGVVILEAQYSSLPIITTKVGGVHEYISEGKTGFVFEENDIAGIAKKIVYLQNNRKLLTDLGHSAHLFVKNSYTQKKLLEANFQFVSDIENINS